MVADDAGVVVQTGALVVVLVAAVAAVAAVAVVAEDGAADVERRYNYSGVTL